MVSEKTILMPAWRDQEELPKYLHILKMGNMGKEISYKGFLFWNKEDENPLEFYLHFNKETEQITIHPKI